MAILAQLMDDVVVHKFELSRPIISVGRHPENDIVVDDSAVSSHHARVLLQPNQHFSEFIEYFIEDQQSTNGTFVNDEKVTERRRLHHGDIIRIAWNSFKFIDPAESDMASTVHMVRE